MAATPITAYVALGSNLGDRANHIRAAITHLGRLGTVTAVSALLDNPSVGGPAGSPPFLNAVAELVTTLSPHALLRELLAIEATTGRVREQRWGPRTIDLDVLLYGDQVIASPELTVPHPLMHERRFVLQPLAEVAPTLIHPTSGVTVADLLKRLDRRE